MSATGQLAITAQVSKSQVTRPVRKYTFAWTADGSGNVTQGTAGGVADAGGGDPISYISGEILRVVFKPGTCSNGYAATLTDDNGIDVLAGQGATLSNASTTHVKPSVPMKDGATTSTAPIQVDDQLTLGITGAGAAGTGSVILYVR